MENRIISISVAVVLTISVGLIGCGSEEIQEYNLAISSTERGSVTSPGEGIFTRAEGTVVNLIAEAEEGYCFVNWTGDVTTIGNVYAASTTITMNGDYEITANFEEPTTQTATIFIDGNPDDWSSLEPAIVDPQGDGTCDADADIKYIYTAIDDSYAYVMVETYGVPINGSAVIEINFDYKPGQHLIHGSACCDDLHTNVSNSTLHAWNDDDLDSIIESYPIIGYVLARGDVMELSIPLPEIENATYFNPTFVNIWVQDQGCDSSTIYPCG